ncbi:hypothetical protein OSJ20_16875, partial [Mycobacterium ulcerans]
IHNSPAHKPANQQRRSPAATPRVISAFSGNAAGLGGAGDSPGPQADVAKTPAPTTANPAAVRADRREETAATIDASLWSHAWCIPCSLGCVMAEAAGPKSGV